ncbi:GNAT family N-acetyltransferase [Luteimonas composti]|uniref:GNAT family N-acetyltransferase n=1 Tax=Luteimonas composti TaxID=398257 RepID=A0ABT6MPA3_9GAMM|nr:GNAT family N-acetyltransferase [Luteimonas composti]MDH7452447.1 GNAT family N-acetyltransferase [Luteimonas composti]
MDVEHRPGQGFHIDLDGHRAVLDYTLGDGRMRITHTGVPTELRGRGIAGQLVRAAFDHARAQGLRVVPQCEYAAAWLERHPGYADLADQA